MDHNDHTKIVWSFSILTIVIHLGAAVTGGYGIFRDELYYIACANHPAIGYVDHPPLSIWLLTAWKSIFGDSLFSIRFLPALAGGLTTFAVGTLARRLGGEKYAIFLACVASMLAPIFLGFFGFFSMNAFDLLFWALAFHALLDIERGGGSKHWYRIGLLIGLGALNKISMLWLGTGIFAGIVLTPHRASLRSAAPWIAGAAAALLFLPFVVWNITHDFAHLEFIRNASAEKYASQNTATFFSGLLRIMNPLAAPVWIAGLWFLLSEREHRATGIAVLIVLAILTANLHSKSEYFAPATTALLPAGAVRIERWLRGTHVRWIRVPYAVLLTAAGFLLLPFTVPVLPVDSFILYQAALGQTPGSNEGKDVGRLPQHYADCFGWKEMADSVAGVYAALPDSEKERCLVYGRNYGEAAAIDYFGRGAGLPPAISRHNNYWYWGPGLLRQDATIIVIGIPKEALAERFESVHEAGTVRSRYAMPYEDGLPIVVCRTPVKPVVETWMAGKTFI
jgi:hypothetical protein